MLAAFVNAVSRSWLASQATLYYSCHGVSGSFLPRSHSFRACFPGSQGEEADLIWYAPIQSRAHPDLNTGTISSAADFTFAEDAFYRLVSGGLSCVYTK